MWGAKPRAPRDALCQPGLRLSPLLPALAPGAAGGTERAEAPTAADLTQELQSQLLVQPPEGSGISRNTTGKRPFIARHHAALVVTCY